MINFGNMKALTMRRYRRPSKRISKLRNLSPVEVPSPNSWQEIFIFLLKSTWSGKSPKPSSPGEWRRSFQKNEFLSYISMWRSGEKGYSAWKRLRGIIMENLPLNWLLRKRPGWHPSSRIQENITLLETNAMWSTDPISFTASWFKGKLSSPSIKKYIKKWQKV